MQGLLEWPSAPLQARNLIGGSWCVGSGGSAELVSPYNGKPLGERCDASTHDVESAVTAAKSAVALWRRVPIKERTTLLLAFRSLLLRDIEKLSQSAARECGKLVSEARAEVLKGIEVLEFACSLQNSDTGGVLEVSRGVTCEYKREPMGVTVGITPFNFPAMIPLWMLPISLVLGNAFILKPSDKVPFTPCLLGELSLEAGLPAGIFSVLHGGKGVVDALVGHPDVAAVAFVGSSLIARGVYVSATSHGKRAVCLGGAKNHLIVVPDADPRVTIDGVVSSFTGCAGQRCMAASVMVAVGDGEKLIPDIVEAAARMQLGRDMGALIDVAARARLLGAIEKAESEGAKILLDGRGGAAPAGFEGGNWLAPTIIGDATPAMECSQCELFGPVLTIVRVKTLDEALALDARSPYGNATSIFTTSGAVARYVADNATSGMVGINIGVPVPREPFSFGGTKDSSFGGGDITGVSGVEHWSRRKKITAKWALQADKNWMS